MSNRITIRLSLALVVIASGCKPRQFNQGEVLASPPSNMDRSVVCPLAPLTSSSKRAVFNGKTVEYYNSGEVNYAGEWYAKDKPWISWDGLNSSLLGHPGYSGTSRSFSVTNPVNLRIVVADVRNIGGKLHYHYFTNGTANSPMENWSSTKALVMLQAAHSIRRQTGYGMLSTLPSGQWIGNHVTTVARTSHNETANWFKSVTGSQASENFVRNWIGTQGTFGGLHSSSVAQLGNKIRYNNAGAEKGLPNANRWSGNGRPNTLMPIVMLEFWKRLAVNRLDPTTWLKNADYTSRALSSNERQSAYFGTGAGLVTDEDLKVLLYGAVSSTANGGLLLGATQSDGVVNAFGGARRLNNLTGGKWRFFGKSGSGFSDERSRDEAVFGGYLCIPADPSRSTLKEGRLIAFFLNVQARGVDKYAARNTALRNVAKAMIPELNGDSSLWRGSVSTIANPPTPDVSTTCTSPNLSRLKTHSATMRLSHGSSLQYQAAANVDANSPRKTDGNGELPHKLFLKHSETDTSNLALRDSENGRVLTGFRYNLKWDPNKQISFRAEWDCNQWKGHFESAGMREDVILMP